MFRLNDGENIGFFHNKIVFPIDVDFGAGIFSIQYAITDFDGHRFILFAVTDGDYSAFLRFFLAVSGMMMPPMVFSSACAGSTNTLSAKGFTFTFFISFNF